MEYKYHCQYQAIAFADSVIAVPKNYPLQYGIDENYPNHFAHFSALMKEMYTDMANSPQAYGLTLICMEETDRNLIRKAQNTIHRLADTLSRLSQCGEMQEEKRLIVSAAAFKEKIKKAQGAVSASVPKYELILSRMADFGFVISDFQGKPFDKNIDFFSVEYPDYPEMIGTMKTYFDCWDKLKNDRSSVKIWPDEFHHHYYRFDYKVTADREKVSARQWIADESEYRGYSDKVKDFFIAFYEYSQRYIGVKFNGDYNYKSKRIARDLQIGLHKSALSLILKNIDAYISEIEAMSESIKAPFTKSSCNHCGFQGATEEFCKFRRNWTFDGVSHDACAFFGFQFDDFDLARVSDYWRLLEMEYGLKKV